MSRTIFRPLTGLGGLRSAFLHVDTRGEIYLVTSCGNSYQFNSSAMAGAGITLHELSDWDAISDDVWISIVVAPAKLPCKAPRSAKYLMGMGLLSETSEYCVPDGSAVVPVVQKRTRASDGESCRRCKNFHFMAENNSGAGGKEYFVCYQCRQDPWR